MIDFIFKIMDHFLQILFAPTLRVFTLTFRRSNQSIEQTVKDFKFHKIGEVINGELVEKDSSKDAIRVFIIRDYRSNDFRLRTWKSIITPHIDIENTNVWFFIEPRLKFAPVTIYDIFNVKPRDEIWHASFRPINSDHLQCIVFKDFF